MYLIAVEPQKQEYEDKRECLIWRGIRHDLRKALKPLIYFVVFQILE